jgi:hypothetical protein
VTEPALADDATAERSTRRALLGAGLVGAVLAAAGSQRAGAAAPGLSDSDLTIVGFAIELELAARDLYDAALIAGATGDLWRVLREQHEAYATRLAGISGISANSRNVAVYDALVGGFTSSTRATAQALENTAAATHIELLAGIEDPEPAAAMASIAAVESQQAVALAVYSDLADDFDALFLNTATPLSPEA